MARQEVNIGVEGNDGTGDSIRESFRKTNENFQELYAVFGQGGTIRFTALSDTPDELTPNTIPLVNDAGTFVQLVELASNSALDETKDDTITFSYDAAGKLVISTEFTQLADDTSPSLIAPLNAATKGIGRVSITSDAAEEFNDIHGTDITVDDLVITKGYADRRYITTGLPIRISEEPGTVSQYFLTINRYVGGDVEILSHGLDSGVNGTPYVYNAEDSDANNLTTGQTYYIRYKDDDTFTLHNTQEQAQEESNSVAETTKVVASGTIAVDDVHTLVDAAYDEDLAGNFLDNVAMPRKSIVRRQGDSMEGTLFLNDHPGDLAGQGFPNGIEDLQAATKFYVDNTSYSSPSNLFVSTQGNDSMPGVPEGKEGSSFTYSYRTINAAAQRAEEMIAASPAEPGPYMQTITKDGGDTDATVVDADVDTAVFEQARNLIEQNRDYIINEVTGFIAYTYPDFIYNVDDWENDLLQILKSIELDINRGQNANYLTRLTAQRYYASSEGRLKVTTQVNQTSAYITFAKNLVNSILTNDLFQAKNITAISKDAIPLVTTSTNHGLADGNQVIFKDVGGMVEINDATVYVKVITNQSFELFTDSNLTIPFDNSGFTNYTTGGIIGLIYQTDEEQFFDTVDADSQAVSGIADKFDLVIDIIQDGINAGVGIVFGSTYKVVVDNGALNFVDQANPANTDTLPGKVLRGKISGAYGQIVSVTNNDPSESGNDTFQLHLLSPEDFIANEPLEYGNFVKTKHVTIFVESGIYEEDYPIRLTKNVSLKGDEFRRVIVRPKKRVSQSVWSDLYFYRDSEFDGLTVASQGTDFLNQINEVQGYFGRHYLTDPTIDVNVGSTITNAGSYTNASNIIKANKEFIQEEVIEYIDTTYPALSYTESKYRRDIGQVVDALVADLIAGGDEFSLEAQGEYYTGLVNGEFTGAETETEDAVQHIATLSALLLAGTAPTQNGNEAPDISLGSGESGTVSIVGNLIDKVAFAFDAAYNPPKRNDEIDVFLLDDATIVRNVTAQGHGGFMCVLDPEGQILTKSPYIQTGSSFSQSLNRKAFRGGMFVDAYVGNLPATIPNTIDPGPNLGGPQSGKINDFTLWIQSDPGEGLRVRPPQLPCPFYIDGRRFQVNAISDYDQANGWCKIYLDADSNSGDGYDESQFDTDPGVVERDIFLQTAGNRSMLANDYTQINDLGYGLVCTNGAFSEQVSTFTYYCHIAYYAKNGSEIRSLNGSNGYGNFGLVSEGADPNEVPDQVTLRDNMLQSVKAFTTSTFANAFDEPSITVTDCKIPPLANSLITIDHGGSVGILNYKIANVDNLSDQDGDGDVGEAGDVIVTGLESINTIGAADPSRTAGTYEGVSQTSSTGSGSGATFNITIDGAGDATVTVVRPGSGYASGDGIVISAADIGGTGSNLTFNADGVYGAGTTNVYNNLVYKLDITGDDVQPDDFYNTLQDTVADSTIIEYRSSKNFIFDAVNSPGTLVTRPSTAVNFDESDAITYRSISFATTDDVNTSLGADEILTTFEIEFDYAEVSVDTTNLSGGNGSAQGDTSIAVQTNITNDDIARITRDVNGNQPGDPGYSGGMIFVWDGKTHQVTGVTDNTTYYTIDFTDVANTNINTSYSGSGLNSGVPATAREIKLGLSDGATAEITIAISLLRATGHDFTQIGTGSFNDSNYPNVLLGEPENSLADFYSDSPSATNAQVWERRKGRVFWVSTDQFGFFRVGKFFNVDQATGTVTLAGELGLSNATQLGFTKGVTIDEFSADDAFADDSGTAVPTEKAIGSYISRRLGLNIAGSEIQPAPTGNRIGPGFLPLNGIIEMEGDLDMGSNKIENLATPANLSDAANKAYVDDKVSAYDELNDLRDVEINNPAQNDLLVATGYKRIYVDLAGAGVWNKGNDIYINGASPGSTPSGTIIDIESYTDEILGALSIVTYSADLGSFSTGDTLTNGSATGSIVDGPVDEFANASENSSSVINVTVERSAGGKATYDLQIENDTIVNADVNSSAAIAQSKLNMNAATTRANATGIAQSDLGLVSFDSGDFSATDGWVTLKTNGIDLDDIQQLDSLTVIGNKTSSSATSTEVSFSDVVDLGLGLEDKDFANSEIDQITGTILTLNGEITVSDGETITQASSGAQGTVQGAVHSENKLVLVNTSGSFNTTNQLTASSTGALGANSVPSLVSTGASLLGSTLVKITDEVYGTTPISISNSGDSIARRTSSGAIQANSYIIGGNSNYEVLAESSGTLIFKTPGQGTILTSSGTTKPTIDTGGLINVGDIGNTASNQSTLQQGSSYSSEVSGLAARWIYTSFIEAPGEKDINGTGIGIGAGTGFAGAAADVIQIITGGDVRLQASNATTTITNNADIDGSLNVDGATTLNGNVTLGNASGDNLVFSGRVNSNILPSSNNTRNIGQGGGSPLRFNTVYATIFDGTATTARYADLAENYLGDKPYESGTVLVFGGTAEVTTTNSKGDHRVAGVVSTNPAHLMNNELQGESVVAVALQGRVPCKVLGVVHKGDMLVTSAIPGYAIVNNTPGVGTVIGKAVEEKLDDSKGTIEVVVGRV